MALEFPITVKSIVYGKTETLQQERTMSGNCGDMVSVRPCADEFENKTFLGVLIGEIALSQMVSFNDETGELKVSRVMHNPAIFIPERNAVVYGCGSWWGRIKSADQLQKITDNDIENVWYVKALKQLDAEVETNCT